MDIFVARQPIFDKKLNVLAYELLYRNGKENQYNNGYDGDKATSAVLINSFLRIGLESLTEGKKAFINFTEKLLKDEIPTIFPKDSIVIEILEDIAPDKDLIEACKNFKKAGYILALDDFVLNTKWKYEELLDFVDIIKVDFLQNSIEERREIVRQLSARKIQLLAEKVETREEFYQAIEMGYTYFQGYFFSKPTIMSGKDVPSYNSHYFQVLNELSKEEPDFNKIVEIIEVDVSLSYELLKLINSAMFYTGHKISSIKHAVMRLGQKNLQKWISLSIIQDLKKGNTNEISKNLLIRGKFGELLATKVGLAKRKNEIFLMGMFSMMDVLMQRPLSDILKELPILEDVKNGLLGKENQFNNIHKLVVAYEKGNWETVLDYSEKLKLERNEIPSIYFASLEWANKMFDCYYR